jgi:hypothetical protein
MAEHKRFSRPFLPWFLLLFSVLMLCTVAGCSATPTPKVRDFRIDDLLIDLSIFPSGWYVDSPPSHTTDSKGQVDGRYIQFRSEGFVARSMHTVYQYRDSRTAAYWYREYLPFGSAERLTSWEVPSELPYESKVAAQFRFACADFRQNPGDDSERLRACLAAGQYDEYVSIFSISMSPDDMAEHIPYSYLERILKAIDERMAHYLGRESK